MASTTTTTTTNGYTPADDSYGVAELRESLASFNMAVSGLTDEQLLNYINKVMPNTCACDEEWTSAFLATVLHYNGTLTDTRTGNPILTPNDLFRTGPDDDEDYSEEGWPAELIRKFLGE